MEFKKIHIILSGIGILILALALLFSGNVKIFILGVGVFVIISPFAYSLIKEANDNTEKEEMF